MNAGLRLLNVEITADFLRQKIVYLAMARGRGGLLCSAVDKHRMLAALTEKNSAKLPEPELIHNVY